MIRKFIAVLALAAVAALSVPLAANATAYVPNGHCTVSPSTLKGGETATLQCDPGTFGGSENVSYVVEGESGATATLASFRRAVSFAGLVKQAGSSGSSTLSVTVPTNARGAYTITGTGATTGAIATAALTVLPADNAVAGTTGTSAVIGTALAHTGFNIATSLIWIGAGILALGLIVLLVLAALRRRKGQSKAKHAN